MSASEKSEKLSVLHILPELTEGGVERHVLTVANRQAASGHRVWVASAGGRLTGSLSQQVCHIEMPVDRKNIVTGLRCAAKLAGLMRGEGVQIVHAHSRVPGWIAFFARARARNARFVFTAHALYSKNLGLWPIARADGVLCVSRAVRDDLENYLPQNRPVRVIYNARPDDAIPWTGSGDVPTKRLIFVGRLSEKKGILTLLDALGPHKKLDWTLRLCGDGPLRPALTERAERLGISDKIEMPGYVDNVAEAIAGCDLFLFPSHREGLPLALIEALSADAPTLASDIPAVRELAVAGERGADELLPPGDAEAWSGAIGRFLSGEYRPSLSLAVHLPSQEEMVGQITAFYRDILSGREQDQ